MSSVLPSQHDETPCTTCSVVHYVSQEWLLSVHTLSLFLFSSGNIVPLPLRNCSFSGKMRWWREYNLWREFSSYFTSHHHDSTVALLSCSPSALCISSWGSPLHYSAQIFSNCLVRWDTLHYMFTVAHHTLSLRRFPYLYDFPQGTLSLFHCICSFSGKMRWWRE